MSKKPQWISIGEAAQYLGISRDTLRRWEKAGKIKPNRSPTDRRYYTKEMLDEAMVAKKKTPQRQTKATKKTKTTSSHLILAGIASFLIALAIGLALLFL